MAETQSTILPPNYLPVNRAIAGFLSVIVPLCSTLSGFLTYQFVNYITQVKPGTQKFGAWIGLATLVTNLAGVILQIINFKEFSIHAVADNGPIPIHEDLLASLVIINYMTATATRIYFARLASTMLRSPRAFLCLSGVLLVTGFCGLILEVLNMSRAIREEYRMPNIIESTRSSKWILLHSIHIGSALAWDLMISGVLYLNLFDKAKRYRFGSIDGKISFSLIFLFESFGLVTFTSVLISIALLVLDLRVEIDNARMSIIYTSMTSFNARMCGVSIFCSFQHKLSDRLRLNKKPMPSTYSTASRAPDPFSKTEEGGEQPVLLVTEKEGVQGKTIKFPGLEEDSHISNIDEEDEMEANNFMRRLEAKFRSAPSTGNFSSGFVDNNSCFTSPMDTPTYEHRSIHGTNFIVSSSGMNNFRATASLHSSPHLQRGFFIQDEDSKSCKTCYQTEYFKHTEHNVQGSHAYLKNLTSFKSSRSLVSFPRPAIQRESSEI